MIMMIMMIIPATPPPVETLNSFSAFLTQLIPLLTHRITSPTPPPSLPPSTISYLTNLSDQALTQIDTHGPIQFLTHPSTSPPSYLRHLAIRAAALSNTFPLLSNPSNSPSSSSSRRRSRARPRSAKRNQILSVAALLSHIISSHPHQYHHILDIGAGHAHLASHLAHQLHLPITALDNNPNLIQAAHQLHSHPNLTLNRVDVNSAPPIISPYHILVGLHACGALGDALIRLSATHRPAAALLVSCCLQKLAPTAHHRPPLSLAATTNNQLRTVLSLPRNILGATNRPCTPPTPQNIRARVTRHALRTLLSDHHHNIQLGDEVRGLSRHALKRGLSYLAPTVLANHGITAPISQYEAERRMHAAEREYRIMRALSIPRVIAGQVLEMAIVLDRAAALQEAGYSHVLTCRLWPPNISPRNLCCAAW